MNTNSLFEYLQLVQDTRAFIQQRIPNFKEPFGQVLCSNPTALKDQVLQRTEPQVSISLNTEKNPENRPQLEENAPTGQALPIKKASPTGTATAKNSSWELQPMPQLEDNPSLRKILTPFLQIREPAVSIFLVLAEENGDHRLFLENVARAITRTFGPASVIVYNEAIWDNLQGSILAIPQSILKQKFPLIKPHELLNMNRSTILILEDLDKYAQDLHTKRVLWNSIQHLFQS